MSKGVISNEDDVGVVTGVCGQVFNMSALCVVLCAVVRNRCGNRRQMHMDVACSCRYLRACIGLDSAP